MNQDVAKLMFALIRSGVCGSNITAEEKSIYREEILPELAMTAQNHDVLPLLVAGLKQNGLIEAEYEFLGDEILKAGYRCEKLDRVFNDICTVLEQTQIPFIPLKGSVIRNDYPEPWMRTSCDIDVLVHNTDLERAIEALTTQLHYERKTRSTHDVGLVTPNGISVEIHFDLLEEERANNAQVWLDQVWDYVSLRENSQYCYEMTDAFFYLHHIAHMAKHFENGGCGIRPFIDIMVLRERKSADIESRNALLKKSGLLQFAQMMEEMTRIWFEGEEPTGVFRQIQEFILNGGTYGTIAQRVLMQQKDRGGKIRYLFSRMFVPCEKLKRYYPILEKHPYLVPVMQVRRWGMLLSPGVGMMAKQEMRVNSKMQQKQVEEMRDFLKKVGLK